MTVICTPERKGVIFNYKYQLLKNIVNLVPYHSYVDERRCKGIYSETNFFESNRKEGGEE